MKAILRLTYLCLSLLFLSLTASAQDVQVKGQVVDDKGEAVIGASVKVKETPQGVITDINGEFLRPCPQEWAPHRLQRRLYHEDRSSQWRYAPAEDRPLREC